MTTRRILFTGGGGAGTEAIWRRFADRYTLHFADADVGTIDPVIPGEQSHAIPFASDTAFLPRVRELAHRLRIDLIVPGVDEELLALAKSKGGDGWPDILVPQPEFVALMLDKLSCAEAQQSAGLAVPATVPVQQADRVEFPAIVKPRSGRGSRGVMKLQRREQLPAYLELHGGKPEDYIVQEAAPGQEYTVFVACAQDATLRAVIPVLVDVKRGITLRARTRHVPEIVAYVRRFQDRFRATGIYNLQCMLSDERGVLPFEVNPRVSTTFCLAVWDDFDPFDLDKPQEDIVVPRREITLRRNWKNTIACPFW